MSVQPVNLSTTDKQNRQKFAKLKENQVAFKGNVNPIVGLMDFIDKGGYPAAFIIQDGLGFIAPRVGKGVLRGSVQKDEDGNPILDENGHKIRKYNWEYARKEGIREVITGPSAFLIPLGLLALVKKYFGSANNVKLNYINSFSKPFVEFLEDNSNALDSAKANKSQFYKKVFEDVITKTINGEDGKLGNIENDKITSIAEEFTNKLIKIENVKSSKEFDKNTKKVKLAELGSVEDDFMALVKNKVGGTANELAVRFTDSTGAVKSGSIGELIGAMSDYFDDALNSTKELVKQNSSKANIQKVIKSFTNKKMGSRILTNFGIFGAVAAFYTQIPKLYNMGLKGNPALKGTAAENAAPQEISDKDVKASTDEKAQDKVDSKEVAFTGAGTALEKIGNKVYNEKYSKKLSDIFELNGPVISGSAMAALLYGFCIPPRLQHASDKYEYGEVIVRDMTAFTALLFGAKALARLFSDAFTRLTGLALNKKDMEGRSLGQKVLDYLNPNDARHSVLSSKQLDSKYTNIDKYKDGVNGFVEFIEGSGGNIKKALSLDNKIKAATDAIVQKFSNKSFADANVDDIKAALRKASSAEEKDLINEFYKLFDANNGLLKRAKTYNSAFGFLSTLLLVPGLIIWLTHVCEKMTERRTAQDFGKNSAKKVLPQNNENVSNAKTIPTLNQLQADKMSMAGFINKK